MERRETDRHKVWVQTLTSTQACKIYKENALSLAYPLSPPSGGKALQGRGQGAERLSGMHLGVGLYLGLNPSSNPS